MSVYVDPLMSCVPNRQWRWGESCHMFADSEEELHAFAKAIGLRREWFQSHRYLPHYDLTARRRRVAVNSGAIEVDRREVVRRIRLVRPLS